MDCQDFEEVLGAYALEALSNDEYEVADAHLAECPKCTHKLQQIQAVVELFPFSIPTIDPPASLNAQIIAHIQAKEAERQFVSPYDATSVLRQTVWQRWNPSFLIASTLLLLVLLGGMFVWDLTLSQQVTQHSSTHVASPVIYEIHGTSSSEVTGQVIYYPQEDLAILVLHGLPQLTGTHVYQSWLLQSKSTQSIGLLNVQNGSGTLDFQGNLLGYNEAAISLENGPHASVNVPKGPVVALGVLKRP